MVFLPLARIIHNEIRGHDPEHRFLFAAGDSSRLFDLDRLDPSEQGPFCSLLESIARDLRTREAPPAPLHPDLTFAAAADFLDRVSAEIA